MGREGRIETVDHPVRGCVEIPERRILAGEATHVGGNGNSSVGGAMDAVEVIKCLKALKGVGFGGVYEKSTFQCDRRKKGGVQKVTVEILDAGPEGGESRYHCLAEGEDGVKATGNPAGTIRSVLGTVHWGDLDR
jgi:hypothetical protein